MFSALRRSKSTVGLDIGSGYVKVVIIDHSGAQPEVSHISYAPLLADAIVEGEVMDPQLVVDTIRSVFAGLGLKSKQVVTSVGGRDVIVKKIPMDRMKEEDARESIRWEAEQHVPFDMESVQLDFQILDPHADGLQMDVLLVAAKRELIEQRVSLLKEAGLVPTVVDVDAFALFNAFEYNHPEAMNGSTVLVNVGHEVSTVSLAQNGAPVLTRDIPFGSRVLRETLRRARGVSAEEAETILQGRADDQAEYLPLLVQGCEDLAVGIERAVAFLSMGGGQSRIERVYLCGGGARIPGLAEAVADRLRTRTEVANPLQRLKVRPEVSALISVDELAPMLMLPVGLALRSAA